VLTANATTLPSRMFGSAGAPHHSAAHQICRQPHCIYASRRNASTSRPPYNTMNGSIVPCRAAFFSAACSVVVSPPSPLYEASGGRRAEDHQLVPRLRGS